MTLLPRFHFEIAPSQSMSSRFWRGIIYSTRGDLSIKIRESLQFAARTLSRN